MLAHTSCSVPEVVAMASLAPAKAIHADKAKGSIEVGKDADLFICDGEFNVLSTYKSGREIYHA